MYERKTPLKNDCPIEKALNVISGKWKPAILSQLLKTNLRLRDIQKGLPEASKRALTQQLKEMIEDKLISKKDFDQYPKKTEYAITDLGIELTPVFVALSKFGEKL